MSAFNSQGKTGVLLVNLGTPDSPKKRDVYRYLVEFLTDGRVIDIPWLKRQLLVRGVIVPNRFRQSAKSYEAIWTDQGSPLKVYGYSVKNKLQDALGSSFHVELAMRYRNPTISVALEKLKFCEKIIVVPLFPQYASATTGSVHQKVMEQVSTWINIPKLIFIDQYAEDPGLIKAFCEVSKDYPVQDYDHVLFSFHGLPERHLQKADGSQEHCLKCENCCEKALSFNSLCYLRQCRQTAKAIARSLDLKENTYSISFQSRLGKEPWLKPFTSDVIQELALKECEKILVFCPAFVSDCLETIYEIDVEYGEEFKQAGGKHLQLVPGLNDHPAWIDALKNIVLQHTLKKIPSV